MSERLFGKIVIVLMGLSLLCTVALPVVRNGAAFGPFVVSLPIGILAVYGYLAFRKSRKRVTPMRVIAILWFVLCAPLLLVFTAILADYGSRHSDVYGQAIEIARNSEICKRELGPTWGVGWPIEGKTQEGTPERLLLKIPLAGEHQKASLRVRSTKTEGTWKTDELTLQLANGQVEQISEVERASAPLQKTADKEQSRPRSATTPDQIARGAGGNEDIRQYLGPVGLMLIYAPLIPFFFVAAIFYILTLQRAMMKCAPESRDFNNPFLWCSLIPILGLIFHFFVVLGMAKSFRKEFARRGISDVDPDSGRSLGIAMCLCGPGAFIPVLGLLVALAGLVLWVVYWLRIARLSRKLNSSLVGAV